MKSNPIQISLVIDETIPQMVKIDKEKYRQIYINLLTNAIKYTDQGSVTISLEKYKYDIIKCTIEDTGCGMTEEE